MSSERTPSSQPDSAVANLVNLPAAPTPLHSKMVTSRAAARLPRQSLGQTREDLVEAAIRIVNDYVASGPRDEDPPVDLLPFVRLDEVLEEATAIARERLVKTGGFEPDERVAPLTAGAFYKAFSANPFERHEKARGATLIKFHRFVTQRMVENPLLTAADAYITLGKQLAAQGHPWSEVVRLGVLAEYMRWQQTPALVLMSGLAFHARDAETAQWAHAVDRHQISEVTRIYHELLPTFGRRMRPGVSLDQMATAVSDLIAGMVLNSRFEADDRARCIHIDADGGGIKEWNLCALAAWAIYDRFTEDA